MIPASNTQITYQGDGTTTQFSFPYSYYDKAHIIGYLIAADETETKITANYSFDEVNKKYIYPVEGTPMSSAYKIKLKRVTELSQTLDLPDQYPYANIEKAQDKIVMIMQEANRLFDLTPAEFEELIVGVKNNSIAAAASEAATALSETNAEIARTAAQLAQANAESEAAKMAAANALAIALANYTAITKTADLITKGPWVDVRAFGAVGDGVTDDTAAIQAALDEGGTILLPMGTYIVGPLWARDNSDVVFEGGAMLYANTSYADEGALDNRVLNIVCVDNVTVVNPVIKMRKADYSGTGRHQHCINITSATNVRVLGGYLYDGGGDGIYVGRNVYGDAEYPATDDPAEDVYLRDVIVDNCYRNGLSIVSVKRMWVDNCQFIGSLGQDPQAGVDIEPNSGTDYIEHLYLSNVRTYNNGGNGIGVNLYGFRDTARIANVTIDNHVDSGSYYGCHTAETYGNPDSRVVINNPRYIDNVRAGLYIESKTLTGFSLAVNNPYIQNCNTSGSTDISAGAACAIASSSLDANGIAMGNITIKGLEVVDTRGTALIQTGVYIKDNQAGLYASDILVDIRKLQGILTRKFSVNGNAKVTVIDDCDVLISYPTSSGSETILNYNRKISNKNATGTVYRTLPDLTADSDGVDYTLICESAYALQVKVQSGQRILPLNQAAGKYVQSNKPGSRIKLRFKYPDWHVVEITGDWTIEGATAAPTAGTWIVGQKVYNSAPAAGGYMGWVCVTAGTPGTWKGFGAIEA